MNEDIFIVLEEWINELKEGLGEIIVFFEPPYFYTDKGYERFRYEETKIEHTCFLKGVRIISGLNASMVLLRAGYVQEMGVIYRTIGDFCNEIMFLLGNYPTEELDDSQKAFLENFFKEEFDIPEKPFLKDERRKTVPKRKILSFIGNAYKKILNPYEHKKLLQISGDTFSGYVHGVYPHIMEMYGGYPLRFHMQGMKETPRMTEWTKHAINYVYKANQIFLIMAEKFRMGSIHKKLNKTLKHYEEITNCKPKRNLKELLSNLKKKLILKTNENKERR